MASVPRNELLPNQKLPYVNSGYIYDNNTLYIEMNGKDEAYLSNILDKLFSQLGAIDKSTKKLYYINFIKAKDVAYVFIPNKQDLFRIAGCDKDGTIRYTETIIKSIYTEEEKMAELRKIENIDDWGLHSELMDEYNLKYMDKRVFTVDPMVTTPGFIFLRSEDCEKSVMYKGKDIIVAMRARVRPIRAGFTPDTLRVTGFPSNFSVSEISKIYSRYSTSDEKKYPIVQNISGNFKIIYDKETTDSYFAQLMTRHFRINIGTKLYEIYSDYWRK